MIYNAYPLDSQNPGSGFSVYITKILNNYKLLVKLHRNSDSNNNIDNDITYFYNFSNQIIDRWTHLTMSVSFYPNNQSIPSSINNNFKYGKISIYINGALVQTINQYLLQNYASVIQYHIIFQHMGICFY